MPLYSSTKNGYSRIIRLDGQCVLRSVARKIKTAFVKLLSFLVSVNKSIAHPYSLISWRSLVSLWTWRSLKEIKKSIQCLKDKKFNANRTVGNENSDVSTGPRRWKLLLAGSVCENTFSVKSSSLYLFRLLLRQIAHKITLFYFNTSFKISW